MQEALDAAAALPVIEKVAMITNQKRFLPREVAVEPTLREAVLTQLIMPIRD